MPLHYSTPINTLMARLTSMQKTLPREVGVIAVNHTKDNFVKQGFQDVTLERWANRRDTGRKSKGRAILVFSGRLKRSIRIVRTSQNRVSIGSIDVPYAQIHNEGGTIKASQNIRSHKRRTRRGSTNVSAHKRNVNIRIPKRQFIGNSRILNKKIETHINKRLNAILK